MKVLKPMHRIAIAVSNSLYTGSRARHRRRVVDFMLQRCASDDRRIANRLFTFSRIHNQVNFIVLQRIDNVGLAFTDFIDDLDIDTRFDQHRSGTPGGNHVEPKLNQVLSNLHQFRLINVTNTQKCRATGRYNIARTKL